MSVELRITAMDEKVQQFIEDLKKHMPYVVISESRPYQRRNSLEVSVYMKLGRKEE
ncbi:hypothetical protein GFC29_3832 (plasmid) [Anoxybacillus sp. B7M1]|uniref:hypothetical protein n=1 Tax=Anoxybacillus sp. B7M1 TaxID=1490057 RepID=UPI0007B5E351|nr:hypothetical protein [Anoxybacillus sp. B7M1]ANB66158.1 hypothetical protein GFC29_3832 [Anoxybacillus sp. B7M1]